MPRESSIKVGDRFGRLLVIKKLPKDEYDTRSVKRTLFTCKCDCGNEVVVDAGNLKKNTKSCGCLKRENARKQGRSQRTVAGFLNNYWGEYKRMAKSRGHRFELTKEEFIGIVTSSCSYCGEPPHLRETRNKVGIPVPVNGVDRIDSNEGYFPENVVSCCTICNKMKLIYSQEEFIMHCAKILNHTLSNGTQKEHIDVAKKAKKEILKHYPFLEKAWEAS